MSPGAQGLGVGLLLLVLGVTAPLAHRLPEQGVSLDCAGWPIGDLALMDDRGRPFLTDNLRGRWTLLAIADRGCGNPCAETVLALSGLLRRIAEAKVLETTQAVLVSLRAADSGTDLAGLLAPQDPRLIGVTAPPEGLAQLADDLGIPYPLISGAWAPPAGGQDRAGSIWLIGPDAVIRAELLPPFDVPLLTAKYLRIRLRG